LKHSKRVAPVAQSQMLLELVLALGRELRCAICLSLMNSPVSLPCSHFFCERCVEGLENSGCPLLCPLCKQAFSRRQRAKDAAVCQLLHEYRTLYTMLGEQTELPDLSQPQEASSSLGDSTLLVPARKKRRSRAAVCVLPTMLVDSEREQVATFCARF